MEKLTILITGASGAIGQAIAKSLENHNLILQYNKNYPQFVPENSLCISCDMRDETAVNQLFEQAENAFGGVDVVVNNCGISEFSLLQDLTLEQWNNMISVNLSSAFLTSKRAIPKMLQKQKGHIINISSIWGEVGASCEVHYSSAKGGLIAFTKALAKELAPSNILVNCISPGLIKSPMNAHLSDEDLQSFVDEIPLARQGETSEVAELVKFFVEKNSYITAQNISINGGLN